MRRLTTVTLLVLATAAAAGSAFAADDGKTLYETKCALCHGKNGVAKPAGKGSRNFDDPAFQAVSSTDAIAKVTSEGKGKMPAYRSTLTPGQIQAIAAHIKTLGSTK
jgi:mono/diheme cytochrome c family protein